MYVKLNSKTHDICAMVESLFPEAVIHRNEIDSSFSFRVGAENYTIDCTDTRREVLLKGDEEVIVVEDSVIDSVFIQRMYSYIKVRRDARIQRAAQILNKRTA